MEKAFASLYFLVQRRIAHTTNSEPLLDLLSFLGVNVKEQIRVAKNATYTSDKTVQEMLYVISEVLEDDTLKELASSDYFALMFNESSDCTNLEQLALHAQYLNSAGDQVKFLKIINVLQPEIDAIARTARNGDGDPNEKGIISLNAEVITKGVKEYIKQEWVSLKNYITQVSEMSDTDLIQRLCTRQALQAVYPNFSQLAKILRVIPTNTADPETTFSQMKLVKTKVRNRTVEQTLDAIFQGCDRGSSLG
ncbi:hypothetical protein HOLleu_23340 [Holothuria leucospilota]|uniref:HAT C-terminal dimerisation domain-containing protein n=1 Tax=Holothuria leucospilota TaxID=206669 RepID=A0A9Q1BU21_HOLLE|nr:hypothetical protein HOLleu_23340 [Holothuria leucospilota]